MRGIIYFIFSLLFITVGCSDDEIIENRYEMGEELSAGRLTTRILGGNAFDQAVPGLPDTEGLLFFAGNSLFKQNWVSSPASTTARDGLGPTFNARACSSCHNKDGRGLPPLDGDQFSAGFLMRISLPGMDENGGPKPVPGYGTQLQEHANIGISHEAKVRVSYTLFNGQFEDGETYELRVPVYEIQDARFGSLQGVLTSPRVGQQVIGLGLIDAISEEDILTNADEADLDGDGISGKANYVWDIQQQQVALGRFGWKANSPTLIQQVAGAFSGDIGITSAIFSDQNCPSPQSDCDSAPNGGEPELSDRALRNIMIYATSLSVPIRRDYDAPEVLKGKRIFRALNCTGCHIEEFTTSDDYVLNPVLEEVKIRPFSDFLLHDMGDLLADRRPDFLATGSEWRTQPLWGIGMIDNVNGHTFLLHDGRARNIQEAILWHGGEAKKSKMEYTQLPKVDREALLAFLNSL